MSKQRKSERGVSMDRTTDQEQNGSQGDEGAMSPPMRQLILSFVTEDSERAWDADAFARRSVPAA